MKTSLKTAALLLVVLALGCNRVAKLNETKSFTLPDGDNIARTWTLSAQPAEQAIKVDVTSDQPVDVFVLLTKDNPNVEDMSADAWKAKAFAQKQGVTSDTLTFKLPANSEAKVVLTPGAKATKAAGTVKLTN